MVDRLGKLLRTYGTFLRGAPGTCLWLVILFATTVFIRHASPRLAHHILERRSTNLHYLAIDPVQVLISSALYIAGGGWFLYFVLYNIFHAPVERRLGTARWLGVVAFAHIGATYLSEGVLYWAIRHGHAPERAKYTLDYGVSYALAGVQAVLTYLLVRPWRYLYLAAVVLFYGLPLIQSRNFTAIGHFSAVLLGLACYPLTWNQPGDWDPVGWVRERWRQSHHRRPGPRRSAS